MKFLKSLLPLIQRINVRAAWPYIQRAVAAIHEHVNGELMPPPSVEPGIAHELQAEIRSIRTGDNGYEIVIRLLPVVEVPPQREPITPIPLIVPETNERPQSLGTTLDEILAILEGKQ